MRISSESTLKISSSLIDSALTKSFREVLFQNDHASYKRFYLGDDSETDNNNSSIGKRFGEVKQL